MTPTMVKRRSPSVTRRPSTAGEAANRVRHSAWPITSTGSAPSTSSAGVRVRPITGATPSTSKNRPVTSAPFTAAPAPSSASTTRPTPFASTPATAAK